MSEEEICFETAVELARRVRTREVSITEVMEAHLERIERVNPHVNAIVTFLPERALEEARSADERLARGEEAGPLFGLPVAHKDLTLTKGIRTTFGSRIFEDFVPEVDDPIVERLKRAGAITVGKTNTPELGAGSQTYNEVFGETLNPYDTARTCGGSSGGAAVSLACGMIPIADGSDMGGSLRNPASFCNVVGFRPSPGMVPSVSDTDAWSNLSVDGPMARTVSDCAMILDAISGPDARSPISGSDYDFSGTLDRDFSGTRIAWSRDLGGLPVDPRVTKAIDARRHVFEDLGCVIEDAEPDFTDADEVFQTLRAWQFEAKHGALLDEHREHVKDTIIWNIEEGRKLTVPDIDEAQRGRTGLYHRVREFMRDHEFLVLPVSQVPPFDVKKRWVEEIEGVKMETYIDWMKSCYFTTLTGLPAISVPCGFTSDGLPVGVQIVGRWRGDSGVLQFAHAFEQATGVWETRPPVSG